MDRCSEIHDVVPVRLGAFNESSDNGGTVWVICVYHDEPPLLVTAICSVMAVFSARPGFGERDTVPAKAPAAIFIPSPCL
jgi:hypothetical protein